MRYIKVEDGILVAGAQELPQGANVAEWLPCEDVDRRVPGELEFDPIYEWDATNARRIFTSRAFTSEEQAAQLAADWAAVRADRTARMNAFEWRISRHEREVRLGDTPTDDIVALDAYMQALANITSQPDPRAIVWPEFQASA